MRVLGSSAAWRYIATNSGAMRQYPGRQTYNNRSAENIYTVTQNHANASNLTSCLDKTSFPILEAMDSCFCFFTNVTVFACNLIFVSQSVYKIKRGLYNFHPAEHVIPLPSPVVGGAVAFALDSRSNVWVFCPC